MANKISALYWVTKNRFCWLTRNTIFIVQKDIDRYLVHQLQAHILKFRLS